MKLTFGAAVLGFAEQLTMVGDNLTVIPAVFDGIGNMGPIKFDGRLAIFRKDFVHVMAWDVDETENFSIIRVIEDEPVIINIEDEPVEIKLGDALVFGRDQIFVTWLQGISLNQSQDPNHPYGCISHDEWEARFGGD